MTIKESANKTIPASDGKIVLKKNGETKDIVAEVISAFKDSRAQLLNFAPHLKAGTLQQTLFNVWNFWKYNIRYKVDPEGVQWVQEPKALWARKEGDCKSLSIAVMCTLYALDIKAAFRFANYNSAINFPTHVYVVVLNNGREIPVDCVWKEFGTEKAYNNKWDYNMTQILRISGLGEIGRHKHRQAAGRHGMVRVQEKTRGMLDMPLDNPHITPEVADVLLDKQYLEMQQIVNAKVNGIGSDEDNRLELEIMAHHNALAGIMGWPERNIVGFDEPEPVEQRSISMDTIAGKAKRQAGRLKKAVKKNDGKGVNKKQASLLTKAGIAVKKRKEGLVKRIGKGLKKVLTTPARLALRTQLPKNAPFFLYLYITDPRVLAKLPDQVAIKRQKALKYKALLVDKLQMKESNFDKTIRNGIMNAFAKSPEDVITQWQRQANYVVGFIPLVMMAAGKGLKALLPKLLGSAAANMKEDIEQFTPSPDDWGSIATNADGTPIGPLPDGSLPTNNYGAPVIPNGGTGWPAPEDRNLPYGGRAYNPNDDPPPDSFLSKEKELEPVIVSNKRDVIPEEKPPEENKDNTWMWILGIGLGAMVLGSKGSKKKRA